MWACGRPAGGEPRVRNPSNGFWLALSISLTAQIARGVLFHPQCRAVAHRAAAAQALTQKVSPLASFRDFRLNDAITRALAEEKYLTPTPIQAQAISTVISGRDVIGIAQTGTGKTAAFALPILHRLAASPRPPVRKSCRVLVLSPTLELSGQIPTAFALTAGTCALEPRWRSAAYQWVDRSVRCSMAWMSL